MLDLWLIIELEDKKSGVMTPSFCLSNILMLLNKIGNKGKNTLSPPRTKKKPEDNNLTLS